MTQELEAMRKAMVIRNYATQTTSTYVAVLKKYLSQLDKPIDSVTLEDIHEWQYFLVHDEKVSWSHFNQIVRGGSINILRCDECQQLKQWTELGIH